MRAFARIAVVVSAIVGEMVATGTAIAAGEGASGSVRRAVPVSATVVRPVAAAQLEVLGVVMWEDTRKALVSESGDGQPRWVTLGEQIGALTVVSIEGDRVVLQGPDGHLTVPLAGPTATAPPRTAPIPTIPTPTAATPVTTTPQEPTPAEQVSRGLTAPDRNWNTTSPPAPRHVYDGVTDSQGAFDRMLTGAEFLAWKTGRSAADVRAQFRIGKTWLGLANEYGLNRATLLREYHDWVLRQRQQYSVPSAP